MFAGAVGAQANALCSGCPASRPAVEAESWQSRQGKWKWGGKCTFLQPEFAKNNKRSGWGIRLCIETPSYMVQSGFLHCCCRFPLWVKGYVGVWKRLEWDLPVMEISIDGSWLFKAIDGQIGILARTSFG